ncbi:hypothetical protein B0H11DRAFT_2242778 [Mycena galericulata]|nr:hypothetical protein B0H11DRAFT_2242778 [Mycena galericulata]
MSVYVNGFLTPTSAYSGSQCTTISSAFAASLSAVSGTLFIIVVDTGVHFSAPIGLPTCASTAGK